MTTKKAYRYDPSASYAVTEHDVEYLNVDGVTRLVRIYQPEGPGPFPMLLSIHGGAWTDKDHTEYESTSTPLAATGIVVAAIGQRVGKGFPYPVQLQDINYGVRWLKAHASDFNGDPDSVGGIGYSSGGHTLPLAAMRPTDPRYSALPLEGSSQVDANFAFTISCWPVIEPYFRYEIAREKGNTDLMEKHHIFFQGDEAMHESTPINIIQSGEEVTLPPAMVMHGTALKKGQNPDRLGGGSTALFMQPIMGQPIGAGHMHPVVFSGHGDTGFIDLKHGRVDQLLLNVLLHRIQLLG